MATRGRPVVPGARRTPSQVRNMMETRVRKLAASYGVEEQIKVTDEMLTILQDFRADRLELMKESEEVDG